MLMLIFLILFRTQPGSSPQEETYLKRSAASWSNDLKHQDAKTRRAAAFALGKLGKHSLPFVSNLLTLLQQDSDASVRSACASSLGDLVSLAINEIVPSLIKSIDREKDTSVRRALALALGKAGDQAGAAEPSLRKMLEEPDADLRQNAAWALGQLGKAAEPAIPRLITALSDPQANVRAEVAQALGNLGPLAQEAVPLLTRSLSDRDPHVQEQCVLALRKMGPLAASAIASLLTLAESSKVEATVRQSALITIESIWPTGLKEPASWSRLQALAQSANEVSVKAAAQQAEKKISTLRK